MRLTPLLAAAAFVAATLPFATHAQSASAAHDGQPAPLVPGQVVAPATPAASASAANSADAALLARGRYLAVAADCAACHTATGGKPFAGGYAIASPMGAIYSTNITPSTAGGIGNYTETDFSRAIRQGIRRDGAHLYPAMPYTAYAALTDADVQALYAYFRQSVAPVDGAAPRTALPFPFGMRPAMAVWNALFLDAKPFEPDPHASAIVNRGAYLTNALEHCAACHTPRNALMGQDDARAFAGGSLGSWYAPNISSDAVSGIGGWTDAELIQYLRTGSVPGKAQAAGPMAEAIDHSLQYLSDDDLAAIVAYLKQTTPIADGSTVARYRHGAPLSEATLRGNEAKPPRGWQIFSGSCAACHQVGGGGLDNHDYPSLYHNSATGAPRADNLIATILFGLQRDAHGKPAFMPAFGPAASFMDRLSDQDVADVSNFVLQQFGNPAATVSVADVAAIRQGGKPPAIAVASRYALPGVLVLAALVVLLIVRRAKRSRRARA